MLPQLVTMSRVHRDLSVHDSRQALPDACVTINIAVRLLTAASIPDEGSTLPARGIIHVHIDASCITLVPSERVGALTSLAACTHSNRFMYHGIGPRL